MGKIIAITNQKGGTGKTTTALNSAAALVRYHNCKVLLVDLDPQGSLTIHTGYLPEELNLHVGSVLKNLGHFDQALQDCYSSGLKLLPSHPSLVELIQSNELSESWRKNLADLLESAGRRFDYVILDCPPTLGEITFQAFC